MGLVELQNQGFIKYIVSQNVDGLFLRSGIRQENLSELHGNVYLEVCQRNSTQNRITNCVECEHRYLRDFDAALDGNNKTHYTGRLCTQGT
jgi:NAD-dependent histone deacetylase SIR2